MEEISRSVDAIRKANCGNHRITSRNAMPPGWGARRTMISKQEILSVPIGSYRLAPQSAPRPNTAVPEARERIAGGGRSPQRGRREPPDHIPQCDAPRMGGENHDEARKPSQPLSDPAYRLQSPEVPAQNCSRNPRPSSLQIIHAVDIIQ
jgi:hypothetical protein